MLLKCLSNQFITTLRNLQGENITEQNIYKGYDPALTLGKGPTVKNENFLSWNSQTTLRLLFRAHRLLPTATPPGSGCWLLSIFLAKHSLGKIPDWKASTLAGHQPRVPLCTVTLSALYFIQVCEHLHSTKSKCKHYTFHVLSHF